MLCETVETVSPTFDWNLELTVQSPNQFLQVVVAWGSEKKEILSLSRAQARAQAQFFIVLKKYLENYQILLSP